jgi:hypothetical protein
MSFCCLSLETPSTVEASGSEPTNKCKTTTTGKTNRKFQDNWQKEFSWLLYNASDNKMTCKYFISQMATNSEF